MALAEAVQMTAISGGEERPFVLGYDESAWKWNRRAYFGSARNERLRADVVSRCSSHTPRR